MIDWLIFFGYLVVWLLYGWRLTIHLLDAEVRRSLRDCPRLYAEGNGGAAAAADNWRGFHLVVGFSLALLWPVVAPVRGVYAVVSAGGLFRTPVEREEAERRELDALRKLACEHGLPMPEVKRQRGGRADQADQRGYAR